MKAIKKTKSAAPKKAVAPDKAPAAGVNFDDPIYADIRFAYEQLEAGNLEEYDGEWVAFLNLAVQGHDEDPGKLRKEVAARHNVDTERVFLISLGPITL